MNFSDGIIKKKQSIMFLFFVLICISFLFFMESINLVYLYLTYSPVPFWDTWDNITSTQLLNNLFSHHNEHRIVLPRLFFIPDTFLDGGRQIIPLIGTHVLMICYGGLLGMITRKLLSLSTLGAIAVSAVLCGVFLTAQQRNILEWGFMVSWPLVYATAILAYRYALEGQQKPFALTASFVFAVLSSFSMANGALALIPVAVIALFTLNWRLLAFSTIGSGALLILQFWGLNTPSQSLTSGDIIAVLNYALAYIGGPLFLLLDYIFRSGPDPLRLGGEGIEPLLSLYSGGVLVIGFALLTFRAIFITKRDVQFTLIAIGGFVMVTALATSTGRFNHGLATAVDGRYGMGGVLFTVVTALMFIDFVVAHAKGGKLYAAITVLLLIAVIGAHQVHMAKRDREWANLRKMPAAALLTGVNDDFVMGLVYPWKDSFPALLEGVQKERLGVYSEPWADWIGKPLSLPVVDNACSGEIQASNPVESAPGALRINGWATYPGGGLKNKRLVITDSNGVVVGYGFNGWKTDKVKPALPIFGASLDGWYGYVSSGAQQPVRAYILVDNGRAACPL